MSPRVDRYGEPLEDDDLPYGRRRCELCSTLLAVGHQSPWCAECSLIVSQRLAVAVEEWRDLDGEHIISERGRIARLLAVDRSHRYPRVSIHGEKRYIHQLVAEAWHGPRPDGCQALHWDDDPDNPHASNIRWGTPFENAADAKRNGRRQR